QPELNRLSKIGDVATMTSLITDEMLERLAVRGTPSECAAELHRRFGDFADRVCCYFPGYDPDLNMIGELGTELAGRAPHTG
ncbi:MAG: LLM class F420-dependent oxidoreductase, partial [Propionibacterium sp.]|nr:LLM class F420-dependent oxidoreductase [Propionibacterium sp.]